MDSLFEVPGAVAFDAHIVVTDMVHDRYGRSQAVDGRPVASAFYAALPEKCVERCHAMRDLGNGCLLGVTKEQLREAVEDNPITPRNESSDVGPVSATCYDLAAVRTKLSDALPLLAGSNVNKTFVIRPRVSGPSASPFFRHDALRLRVSVANVVQVQQSTRTVNGRVAVSIVGPESIIDDNESDVVAIGRHGRFLCTGIVIEDNIVLTARHCLPATEVVGTEQVGGATVASRSSSFPIVRSVASDEVDAALLLVPGLTSAHPRRGRTDNEEPAGYLRAVGFGANDSTGRRGAGRRRSTDLAATGWNCTERDARETGCIPGREMVVRGTAGGDTCDGDSGGPLFERYEKPLDTLDDDDRRRGSRCAYRLVSITSRPIASARRACGDGGIYVRVDALAPWIDGVISGWTAD